MDWKDTAEQVAPGVIGALVALRWIGGTPWQLVSSFLGGACGAFYGTPHAVVWFGTNAGLSGFLLGLFGMAVASRIFDLIARLDMDGLAALFGIRKRDDR